MFTGIIEATGSVKRLSDGKLEACVPAGWNLIIGESVAVNGACLTVTAQKPGLAVFGVSPETAGKTSLNLFKPGSVVNLERALAVGSRLGGHFVTGHVDGTTRLVAVKKDANSYVLEVALPSDAVMVEKGSVALDGVSLTVFEVSSSSFKVAVIPHTWKNTTFKNLKSGSTLNIEYDILGKYARQSARPGITKDFLKANGFL